MSARSAASPSPASWATKVAPCPDETGVAEVEDRPEVAEPVLDRRAGQGELRPRREATQLLAGLVGWVLDGLRLVEDQPPPRHLGQRLDVAHGGAVRRDQDVGVGHLGGQLVGRGTGGAVVDDGAQLGREPRRLGLPVADDRGRGDDERGPFAWVAGEVGEDRRRLAQTHVERQAAAELDGVEEPEPAERLGLVGAELADEPRRGPDRLGRDGRGLVEEIGRPTAAFDEQPLAERRALEADGVTQDLGAGQLGGAGPFGERGRRLLEVDPVELDPPTVRLHEGAGLGRQPSDLVGGELDVVEDRRPPDRAQLPGPDDRVARRLDEQAQTRLRLPPRQRRNPDLEPGRLQRLAGAGHEVPRLVGAEVHLPATQRSRPLQLGQQPLEPHQLLGDGLGRLGGRQRDLHVDQGAVGPRRQHRQEPGVPPIGRVELDDELGARRARHRSGPTLHPVGDLGAGRGRSGEDRTVEPGGDRLGDIGGAPDGGRRRGQLQHAGRLGDDGMDHGAEVLEDERARRHGRRRHHPHRTGHDRGERVQGGVVEQCRLPAHAHLDGAPLAPDRPERRDHVAAGHLSDGHDGGMTEPAHAGADPVVVEPAADGDEPAEGVSHRDRHGFGPDAARERDPVVDPPAEGGPAEGLEPVGELLVRRRRCGRAGGPHDDFAIGPRGLELHPLVVDDPEVGRRRAGPSVQAVVDDPQALELVGEVGDDLVAFRTREALHRLEPGLRIGEQAVEQPRRTGTVLVDQLELVVSCPSLGDCPDGSFESFGVVVRLQL